MTSRVLFAGAVVVALGAAAFFLLTSGPDLPEQSAIVESLENAEPPSDGTPIPETTTPAAEATNTPPSSEDTTSAELQAEDPPDDFPAIVDNALRDVEAREFPIDVGFEIIETLTHDTGAFTQGFEISEGRLFESTGLVGESTIRELDLNSGEVIRSQDVDDVFAEGLTVIEDPAGTTAIQITWQDGVAFRYDIETFEVIESYTYEGQGWGICDAGDRLVMSNGSDQLQFRDRDSFELLETVDVRLSGEPVQLLNELECIDGAVWANIWMSSLIVQIDPESGSVNRVLNARSLTPEVAVGSSSDVLNGIAYDPADSTVLLTGKRWPVTYRLRLFDQ